jgi:sigma-B regulation protein RsbU (phosphoserine phosphatase)
MYPERVIKTAFNNPGPLNCDPDRIAQLFSNLLANAVTHGSSDTPVVVRSFKDEDFFELSVTNNGTPIPPNILEKIFEPFTRETARPSQNGLGLGLYIASEITRAHQGELHCTSTEDETRFTFRMPWTVVR